MLPEVPMLISLAYDREVARAVEMFHRCNTYPHAAAHAVSLCTVEGSPYLGIDEPFGIPLTQGLLRRTGKEVYNRYVLMYLGARNIGPEINEYLCSDTVADHLMQLLSGRKEEAQPNNVIMWPPHVPTEEYHTLIGFCGKMDGTHQVYRTSHVHTPQEAWSLPLEDLWHTAQFTCTRR